MGKCTLLISRMDDHTLRLGVHQDGFNVISTEVHTFRTVRATDGTLRASVDFDQIQRAFNDLSSAMLHSSTGD